MCVRASSTPARPWLPSAEGHSALGVRGDWRPYSGPTMELCLLATEVGGGSAQLLAHQPTFPCFPPSCPDTWVPRGGGRLGAPGSGTRRKWWPHGTPRRRGRGWLEPEGTGAEGPGCLGERREGLRVGLADPRAENFPLWGWARQGFTPGRCELNLGAPLPATSPPTISITMTSLGRGSETFSVTLATSGGQAGDVPFPRRAGPMGWGGRRDWVCEEVGGRPPGSQDRL